jgi:hypothetical protein
LVPLIFDREREQVDPLGTGLPVESANEPLVLGFNFQEAEVGEGKDGGLPVAASATSQLWYLSKE